jgi:hypothetical protein
MSASRTEDAVSVQKEIRKMTFDEAKRLLDTCTREEIRDSFGDSEVYWMDAKGCEVAFGYFGSSCRIDASGGADAAKPWSFYDRDARALRFCGKIGKIEAAYALPPR